MNCFKAYTGGDLKGGGVRAFLLCYRMSISTKRI